MNFSSRQKNMINATRDTIRNVILEEGKKYREFGERVPSSWIALQEKFMLLKKNKRFVVQLDEVQKINRELDVPLDDEEIRLFLKLLHNMGYILYIDTSTLCDKIILDPKLVIDAMKCFITCEKFVFQRWKRKQFNQMRRSGKVKMSHVRTMLKEKGRSDISEHCDHLISIMRRLDLICEPMIYNNGIKATPEFYLVPCIMSADMPQGPLEGLHIESGLTISFSSQRILPPAIFNRLVSSCLSFWEVFEGHFYNGLAVLKSGKFHLIQIKKDVKQIEIIFAHTESHKCPDRQWCSAIQLFLTETITKVVDTYCTQLESPISCNSSVRDIKIDEADVFTEVVEADCRCQEYIECKLEDVNLMRIAQRLRRVDLHILCTVLLNDAQASTQIESDYRNFKGDVKAFYVLQEWKHTTDSFTPTELKRLLHKHIEDLNKHIICQAMQCQTLNAPYLESTTLMSNVYDEFLNITADHVTYMYVHLGLELGLALSYIESLKEEKDNRMTEITRSMLRKWHDKIKEEATILKLATAFQRCGIRNLEWMQQEFDVEKSSFANDFRQPKTRKDKCTVA